MTKPHRSPRSRWVFVAMFGLVAIAGWFVWQGMDATERPLAGNPVVEGGGHRLAYSIVIAIELALLLWRLWQTEFLSSTSIGLALLLGGDFVAFRYGSPWGALLSPSSIHAAWLLVALCWLVVVAICHKLARTRDPEEEILPEMKVISTPPDDQ